MKHKEIYFMLFGFLFIMLCTQCTKYDKEELFSDLQTIKPASRTVLIDFPEKVDTFFINEVRDTTLYRLIQRFKNSLTDTVRIETLRKYVENYGYPLWERAFHTELGSGFLYAVPVVKDGEKIETIWFFKVTGKRLHSFSTNRKTLNSFDWMYDYFTSDLYFKPNSQRTKVECGPQSRAWQCNDIYTGHVDEFGVLHDFKYSYTHCWDDGFGGGSDYVYEDENEGGEDDNEDIDYEVAPPPDSSGGGEVTYVEGDNTVTIENILANEDVKSQMESALSKMKADLANGRREYGFWIFYDTKTKKINAGNLKNGDLAKGTTSVNMAPGSNAPKDNGSHIPTSATAVAFYHVHTAMSNIEKGFQRKTGLSPADTTFADKNKIIMIAEDYIGVKDKNSTNYYISSGHDKNDSTKTYIYKP